MVQHCPGTGVLGAAEAAGDGTQAVGGHYSCAGLRLHVLQLVALQRAELAWGARGAPKQLGDTKVVLQHPWLSLLHCQPGTGPDGHAAEEGTAELSHLEQDGTYAC